MSNLITSDMKCTDALRWLDPYIDNQLDADATSHVLKHLEACPACFAELELRRRLRTRLKSAVDNGSTATPYLTTKVLASVRAAERAPRWISWQRQLVATAAILVVSLGIGSIAYQLGHLRFTTEAQESYIAKISSHVSSIMRVGLGDHVHCAVFRRFPKNPPPLEHLGQNLAPEFKGLVNVVKPHVPKGFRIVLAHQCRYNSRPFIHLTMKSDTKLISLVITRKKNGEKFDGREVVSALSGSGLPMYASSVQRFQIAGFETRDHLAYLVSDMPGKANSNLMLALGPAVQSYLTKIEI